ncbi:MAG: two-component sensor histidine kinase [Hyphomicrobiaceae bacterium]|nr:two-component sensor histidine kinase [Hyphomicrobiaceae bacterium]
MTLQTTKTNRQLCSDVSQEITDYSVILEAIPHPLLLVGAEDQIEFANHSAELFLGASEAILKRGRLQNILTFGCPLLSLVDQVRRNGKTVNEYGIEIFVPRTRTTRLIDVYAGVVIDGTQRILVVVHQRSMVQMIKRQLQNRSTARSVSGMAAMLSHEIKNPLSGIRGAAQLLEPQLSGEDRGLSRLICEETDRILVLLDKMEAFGAHRQLTREPVNVHTVLKHVRKVAKAGFGSDITFKEQYDPSLPPVTGVRDRLIQAFLNLVKNACEAIVEANISHGRVQISTAFRSGVKLKLPGSAPHTSLPLVIEIADNGVGIPDGLSAHVFDPFVSSKCSGSGLGLSFVAKIIDDHGGTVEFERLNGQTIFRVLMPLHDNIRQ